jgi:hypothetical protein
MNALVQASNDEQGLPAYSFIGWQQSSTNTKFPGQNCRRCGRNTLRRRPTG